MAIKLIQLLCPARHCVLALAYDDSENLDGAVVASFESQWRSLVARKVLNPYCGICKSDDLHSEVGTTRFRTMEEVKPALEREQARNMASRAIIEKGRAREN